MKNSIDAGIQFSFKGVAYNLSTMIDLDLVMQSKGQVPDIHWLLATQHNIDTYSYQYDAMESHPVRCSNASGIALKCLTDNQFDELMFYRLWHENNVMHTLQKIANEHLHIDNLAQQSDIKMALMAAYEAGRQTPVK